MECSDSWSPIPPHFVSFAWRYRACAPRSLRGIASAASLGLGLLNGLPTPWSSTETTRSPRFLRSPPCVHAPLSDPGELFTSGHTRRVDTAFRLPNNVGARGDYLSGLNHAACTLPVYASQRGLLRHHATLGSGWWPTSAGRGWVPAGLHRKVSEISITSLPPFPGFAWRTRKENRTGWPRSGRKDENGR